MSRTGLTEVSALPDPLQQYNFDLIIPNIPIAGDTRSLTIQCMSTSLPAKSTEEVNATLHGVTIQYAGRQTWQQSLPVQYHETRALVAWNILDAWVKYQRDTKANTGTYHTEYKTTGIIRLYDDHAQVIKEMKMFGMFPRSVDDPQFDGSGSAPVPVNTTFVYDYTD